MRNAILIALLLVPFGSGIITEAYGEQEDVVYGFATGMPGSAYGSLGFSAEEDNQFQLDGCSISIIREDGKRGRANAFLFFGGAAVEVEFNNATKVLHEVETDGTHLYGSKQHPRFYVEQGLYGGAELFVDGEPYLDPATGGAEFEASYYLAPQGYRHDGLIFAADGATYQPGGSILLRDSWETHLRVQGQPGEASTSTTITRPVGNLPLFTTQSAYQEQYTMENAHFQGEGKVSLSMDANALDGMNHLIVVVRNPSGETVANYTVDAALGAPGSGEATFPLDEFGPYSVVVSGSVALSSYELTMEQRSLGPFDLWMWWENVTVGVPGWYEFSTCFEFGGSPNAVVGASVGRLEPPQFNVLIMFLAIVGSIVSLMVGGRLFSQTVVAARFKETMHKK